MEHLHQIMNIVLDLYQIIRKRERKLFGENGYYEHCRKRYDLVLAEPDKLKAFIGTEEKIKVHMLFVSSKPLEMELHDKDEVVTFLSLNIFEKYVQGKLISGEDDSVIGTKFEI